MTEITNHRHKRSLLLCTQIVYGLQLVGVFLGWLHFIFLFPFIGLIINLVKLRSTNRNPLFKSHFLWQIKTFCIWFSVQVISFILMMFVIGFFIMLLNGLWMLYRIIKGWLALNDEISPYERRFFGARCKTCQAKGKKDENKKVD